MCLLFFAAESHGAADGFQETVRALVPDGKMEVYRTTRALCQRLRQPSTFMQWITILFVANRAELSELLTFGELLSDLRIILLLPDDTKETIAAGHLLRPRFLSYVDGDFAEVVAVLNKMLTKKQPSLTLSA